MATSRRTLRDDLLWAFDESKAKGKTLSTILKEQFTASQTAVSSGREVSSHTIGSQTVSFFRGGGGNYQTVAERRETWGELRRLYTQVYASLGGTPTDTQVWTEMDFRLTPAIEMTQDFASLRQV